MSLELILINISILLLNIILYLNAKKVVTFLNHGVEDNKKTKIFKAFNIVLFFTHLMDMIFQEHAKEIISVGYTIVSIYIGMIIYEVSSYYNRIKFGTKKETGNKITYDENYNTKINNIILFVSIFSLVLLSILKIWNMESALEQKGFIGVILAALLFTSNHWLPNILKGLTLMNSNRISKNDIIKMNNNYYSVFDMGLQYTRLLDITSNTRLLLENSKFSENEILNLSKKASMDGYRNSIEYNVGYPNIDKNIEQYDEEINKFKSIFEEIYKEETENKNLKINFNSGYELQLIEAGDYALKWKFSFYYIDFPAKATTGAIRKILSSKYVLNEIIQRKAHQKGISLATPQLIEANIQTGE